MVVELIPNFFESAGAIGWWTSLALLIIAAGVLIEVAIYLALLAVALFFTLFAGVLSMVNWVINR